MPMFDFLCENEHWHERYLHRVQDEVLCRECGGKAVRTLKPMSRSNGVIDDSIPGGVMMKHGICNPDGTPRRYDSKTDIKKASDRTGWINYVEHKGSPGSDKSKHTTRWT